MITAQAPQRLRDYEMCDSYRSEFDQVRTGRKNLLIVGSTTAGKTTFLRAFLREVLNESPAERIVSIEDTIELNLGSDSCVALHATPAAPQIRLVKVAMRLRPDRLVVGEVRDEATRAMIQAFGTGHPGCCTVHGGSLIDGLVRVQQLSGMEVGMIAGVMHYAVLMERDLVTGKRAPKDFARVSSSGNTFTLNPVRELVA